MNTEANLAVESKSLDETLKLGAKLGANLKGGEVIELRGDIGSGKTALVRGIASSTESDDEVASPSFTLSRIYKGRVAISHYDFYRLDDPGIMKLELAESIDSDKVVIIEWAGIVEGVLDDDRLVVEIKSGKDESDRKFVFKAPKKLDYLLVGVNL